MSNIDKKRQTIFVQRGFQGRSIAVVIGIIATSGLLSGVLLYFLLSSELSSELQTAHQQIRDVWERLAPTVVFSNIIAVAITSIAAAFAVLYQSHKVAGPMTRLQKICEEVTKGNFNPVTSLRKADQLSALANTFENMVISLQERKSVQQKIIIDAISILEQLEHETDIQKKGALISDLQARLAALQN